MPQIVPFAIWLCFVVLARTQQLAYEDRKYRGMGGDVPKDPIGTETPHDGASQTDLRRQSQNSV
ncbi:hypothetical protein NIG5292_00375 [Nereida ignava]|uniref:Uncharacterized protein n=1 Tax=Nereida ignava TaxID=282199 RepID=A0A0U1NI01_9RHOB|nr:hypothetical protein NIG5292_00375 [Nereida ignava]SFJ46418.1 hypothetical protein SAMN02745667_01363 [Nereida ignava DSM 16309]